MVSFGDLSSLGNFAGPFMGILKGILYAMPILIIVGFFIIAIVYIRKQKIYNIDVILMIATSDNLVIGNDRGGIIRTAGGEKFVLKKRKKSLAIPDRKHWLLNEKGRFTVTLYKYGEDDFSPTKVTPLKELFSKAAKPQNFPEAPSIKPMDLKRDFDAVIGDPRFIPMPSDSKSHYLVQSEINRLKHQKVRTWDKFAPVIQYAIVGVLIFLTMFYGYQFAQSNIDKAVTANKDCLAESSRIIKTAERICGGGGESIPEEIPKPPV